MAHHSFNLRHAVRIVLAMGWADFFLKYRGSFLGYLWSFAFPITRFIVILHIFRHFTGGVDHYPLYLFLGIILWEYFSTTTQACMQMLQAKATIIKKVRIPRILLILSVGWMHIIILCTYILMYVIFAVASGGPLPFSFWYYTPLVMVQASLLALGVGMLLASFVLRYRDIQHMWGVMLQVIFWLTPIAYVYRPDATIIEDARRVLTASSFTSLWDILDVTIRFQPLSILLQDARRAMLYPDTLGVPSLTHVAWFTAACAAFFIFGLLVFQRRSRYFIEEY